MLPLPFAEQGPRPGNSQWSTYRLFGVTLASDFPFANRLAPGSGAPDLTFDCVPSAPVPGGWEWDEPAYASPPRAADGKSDVLLYRSGACWILRFRVADFYLWPDLIVCHLSSPEYRYLAEIQFLGLVLACWLEYQGVPALHASAVAVNDRAVAFLSSAGGGKSSMAATLMQAGYPLITDDILTVRRSNGAYVGHPAYPQMRMWPDQARTFLGRYEDLDLVHPAYSKRRVPIGQGALGTFCDVPSPLACLYLPERRRNSPGLDARVEINPLSRREGLMALIGQSFAGPVVEGLGLQARRMPVLASLASKIPMRRVVYPEGLDYLPRVRDSILSDLASLERSAEKKSLRGRAR